MPRKRPQRRTAGPGRPRKYPEGIKFFGTNVAGSTYDRLYALKERLGVPFSELLTWLVDLAEGKIDELDLKAKVKHLMDYVKQLEQEKVSLLEALEKERQARERAEKEAEYWKQKYYELKGEKPAYSYNEGKLLRTLAEHAREGVSWADLCAEVLDLRDEKKMRRLMSLAFNVKKTDRNIYEKVFYPKRTSPEFQKWVLVRPNKNGPVFLIDYELWPRDVYEAAEASRKARVEAKANMVKKLKTGKAAERFIEMTFESIYHNYMEFIKARQGKKAKEYLEEKVPAILVEQVFPEIAPEEIRRAVLAVIQRHEKDWNEAFVSNLRRVILKKAIPRPVEVRA